jgi:hypothetical protein
VRDGGREEVGERWRVRSGLERIGEWDDVEGRGGENRRKDSKI